jgi:hypothetical protein
MFKLPLAYRFTIPTDFPQILRKCLFVFLSYIEHYSIDFREIDIIVSFKEQHQLKDKLFSFQNQTSY